MESKREGCKTLKAETEIPELEYQVFEDFKDFAISKISEELVRQILQVGEKNPVAFMLSEPIQSLIQYSRDMRNIQIRRQILYKDFTFCKDCTKFKMEEFNGGFCLERKRVAHIMDGCTFGEKQPRQGSKFLGNEIEWYETDEAHNEGSEPDVRG